MSTIQIIRANESSTTSASAANTVFTTFETASNAIDEDNLRTEAVGRQHCDGYIVTTFNGQSANTGTPTAYNSTTDTHVSHGTAMQIAVNQTIEEGDVVRFHANVYVDDVTLDTTDTDGGIFRFRFYWDIGAGYVAVNSAQFKYSLAVRPEDVAIESTYKNRRLGFSLCYIHQGANIAVTNARVYVSLTNNANSIELSHTIFNVIIQKH